MVVASRQWKYYINVIYTAEYSLYVSIFLVRLCQHILQRQVREIICIFKNEPRQLVIGMVSLVRDNARPVVAKQSVKKLAESRVRDSHSRFLFPWPFTHGLSVEVFREEVHIKTAFDEFIACLPHRLFYTVFYGIWRSRGSNATSRIIPIVEKYELSWNSKQTEACEWKIYAVALNYRRCRA